jgi:hypothetical protein
MISFPLFIVVFLSFFIVFLSSSHYCSFYFSWCSSPLCIATLSFTLLFTFPFCIAILMFHYCSPILSRRFFTLLLFLCCNSLKDLVLPTFIPSYKSWKSFKVINLHVFQYIYIYIHVFCSYVLI